MAQVQRGSWLDGRSDLILNAGVSACARGDGRFPCFFFSSRRRHTRCSRDWSSDVCSSDLNQYSGAGGGVFKSTDGGKTWRALSSGLPKGIIQVDIAIAASQPTRLYASVATDRKSVV